MSASQRPLPLPVDTSGIPSRLKALNSWVCWRYEQRGGRWTKPPVCAKSGRLADVSNPETWACYSDALAAYQASLKTSNPLDGVGIVLPHGEGVVGLDIDKCFDEAGNIERWAHDAARSLGSYFERSPSGKGLRGFVLGKKSHAECRRSRFECYDGGRYVTLTGHRLPDSPPTIEPQQGALDALLDSVFGGKLLPEDIAKRGSKANGDANAQPKTPTGRKGNLAGFKASATAPPPSRLSDEELLSKALAANDGGAFRRLRSGDTSGEGGNHSSSDLALCNRLAFWTGRDGAQIDRLFRQSGLMRPKWDERRGAAATYGELTIQRAIEGTQTTYQGHPQPISENRGEFRAYSENPQEDRERGDEYSTSSISENSENKKNAPAFSELKWGEFIPLEAPSPPSPPVEAIPRWLGEHAASISRSTETPLDLAVVAGLGALSSAAAGWLDISPAWGWREPTNLYLLCSYPSGGGKSPVWKAMHRPIERADIEAHKAWVASQFERAAEVSQLEQEVKGVEARIKAAIRANEEGDASFYRERVAGLLERISKLQEPPARRTTEDCTPEGLLRLMAGNGGLLGVLSAEGHLFAQLAGLYSSGTPNLNLVLKAHAGDAILSDRAGRAPMIIEHPLLTLCLGVQPGVLQEAGQNKAFRSTGFLARFLFATPSSTIGFRSLSLSPVDSAAAERYQAALERIVARVPTLQSPTLMLSQEAGDAFLKYRRSIERERAPGGALAAFGDWAAKLDGHILRIAALLHIADYVFEPTIPQLVEVETIHRAYLLADYFIQHARAAFIGMVPDAKLEGARKILAWLKRQGKPFMPKRTIQQALKGTFPSLEDFEPAFEVLAEHGLIHCTITVRAGERGRTPSPTVHVHPEILRSDSQKRNAPTPGPSSDSQKWAEAKHSPFAKPDFPKSSEFPGNSQNSQNSEAGGEVEGEQRHGKSGGRLVREVLVDSEPQDIFEDAPDSQKYQATGNAVVDGIRKGAKVVPIRASSPPVDPAPSADASFMLGLEVEEHDPDIEQSTGEEEGWR